MVVTNLNWEQGFNNFATEAEFISPFAQRHTLKYFVLKLLEI